MFPTAGEIEGAQAVCWADRWFANSRIGAIGDFLGTLAQRIQHKE